MEANPVQEAEISIALVISKSLTKEDLKKRSVWNSEENENSQNNIRHDITNQEFVNALKEDSLHLFDLKY